MRAAANFESKRRGFSFFAETNLSACRFGRQITLLNNVMPRPPQLIGQLSKQEFAFYFPIVLRPIADLHKVSMLNAMDLLSRLSRSKPSSSISKEGLRITLKKDRKIPRMHHRSKTQE